MTDDHLGKQTNTSGGKHRQKYAPQTNEERRLRGRNWGDAFTTIDNVMHL